MHAAKSLAVLVSDCKRFRKADKAATTGSDESVPIILVKESKVEYIAISKIKLKDELT
jgi:hypothetical protein